MKRIIRSLLFIITAACLFSVFTAQAHATGGAGVVFLADGGTGDGMSPDRPVGSLDEAYAALDLSGDCKVVICGSFTQGSSFSYVDNYSGKVTFTSVYGGADYRESGAVFSVKAVSFVMKGETVFDDINITMLGKNYLVVCNCFPFTIGENVNINIHQNTTANVFGDAFAILGGYQNGEGDPPYNSSMPVNIKVMSGKGLLIGAFSRAMPNSVLDGECNIHIGGTAEVNKVYLCTVNCDNVRHGKITLTVSDKASVEYILGAVPSNKGIVTEKLTLKWLGGSISKVSFTNSSAYDGSDVERVVYTDGIDLVYEKKIPYRNPSFESISSQCAHVTENNKATETVEPDDWSDITDPVTPETETPVPIIREGTLGGTVVVIAVAALCGAAIVTVYSFGKKG